MITCTLRQIPGNRIENTLQLKVSLKMFNVLIKNNQKRLPALFN